MPNSVKQFLHFTSLRCAKTKHRSRRPSATSPCLRLGINTFGTVPLDCDHHVHAKLDKAFVAHKPRAFHKAPRRVPSAAVGNGPCPARSKSMRTCWGRNTISTAVPSGTPGARKRPKGGHAPKRPRTVRLNMFASEKNDTAARSSGRV